MLLPVYGLINQGATANLSAQSGEQKNLKDKSTYKYIIAVTNTFKHFDL